MKHQYFGDTRDLFKYDLVLHIMKEVSGLRNFTFIPMLTHGDRSRQGNQVDLRRARAGYLNVPLALHLAVCVREGRRNLAEILPYFTAGKVPVNIHGELFTGKDRSAYFKAIPDSWLQDSLVFLDPDIGLEVANPTEKHLLYTETGDLYERMGEGSILMLFQFIPRVKRDAYVGRRTTDLAEISRGPVLSISDNRIIFFFLPKSGEIAEKLGEVLARYQADYPDLSLSSKNTVSEKK